MQSDSNRLWFVYYQEKEMGPFSEQVIHEKLKSGELDSSAYMFTDGLSDWEVISELSVFKNSLVGKNSNTDSLPLSEPKVSSSGNGDDLPDPAFEEKGLPFGSDEQVFGSQESRTQLNNTNPTTQLNSSLATNNESPLTENTLSPVRQPTPKSSRLLILLLISLLFLGVYLILKSGLLSFQKTPPPPPPSTPSLSVNEVQTPHLAPDIDWLELQGIRNSKDPQSPPFRLASKHFADLRPILVGVLSVAVDSPRVQVAIYPDSELSLMPIPRIWFLDLPVISGYFTVGPLTDAGQQLTPGKYHVAVSSNGVWLGEVSFDLNPWPTGTTLSELQENLQTTRKVLAEKEKTALEAKLGEVFAAAEQLQSLSRQFSQGTAAKQWGEKSQNWTEAFQNAVEDQKNVLEGPMFFPQTQQKLHELMTQLLVVAEATHLQIQSGPKSVTQKHGKGVGSLWADYTKNQNLVRGEIQLVNPDAVLSLKINPEVVKKRLVEFRQ